jgi:uncharacterized protein (TIGR00375 family)
MEFIADLHIHSPFSRATSRECSLAGLFGWARLKGIQVVATGDITHPLWRRAVREELVPAEPGLFRLRNEAVPPLLAGAVPGDAPVRFLLSAEISCIYRRHDAVRRVHNLVYLPDLESAERLTRRLEQVGNLTADGRPILGLDSRDLLEMVLELAPGGFLVPAHIWTPWFSLFGSRSGFDSIEECFGDLSGHVFALETGLSSDPSMNRLVSALDRFALISNSDCHSPANLGREANRFATGFDFHSLREALAANRGDRFLGTIEFFPEEGKYHLDGHRACSVRLEPEETRRHGGICPVCGQPVTVGVLHRLLELSDRQEPPVVEGRPGFISLVPLAEIIAELLGVGAGSKAVRAQYARLVSRFGSELALLLAAEEQELAAESPFLAEAVSRVRSCRVRRQGGYDGEYGVIRLFDPGELPPGAEVLAGIRRRPRGVRSPSAH